MNNQMLFQIQPMIIGGVLFVILLSYLLEFLSYFIKVKVIFFRKEENMLTQTLVFLTIKKIFKFNDTEEENEEEWLWEDEEEDGIDRSLLHFYHYEISNLIDVKIWDQKSQICVEIRIQNIFFTGSSDNEEEEN